MISCNKPLHLSGIIKEEIRSVNTDFNLIKSTGAYDVEIMEGAQDGKIKLTGDSNILGKIIVEVNEKTLLIKQKPGFYTSHGDAVKISLNAQNLKGLTLTGSGSIQSNGIQETDELKIVLDGSGDISTRVSSPKIEVQLNGSGDIKLSGQTDNLTAGVAGSGDIHAFELKAKKVSAGLTGSGNLEVYASESLSAGVTGSGEVFYKGEPKDKDFKVAGSGQIIKAH